MIADDADSFGLVAVVGPLIFIIHECRDIKVDSVQEDCLGTGLQRKLMVIYSRELESANEEMPLR